jgi:hypothetical protein
MRLQTWITRVARREKANTARATGVWPDEVRSHLYDALAAIYSALDPSRFEIRTVTVAPGKFEDDVSCQLQIVSLYENPSYEALSYAWGSHRPTRKVFINGIRHQVSENLESALRHLRYKHRPRTLWVDALCIDQSNVEERNIISSNTCYLWPATLCLLDWRTNRVSC